MQWLYGYPSFFITISPYQWTFPFSPFVDEMRGRYFKDVTDISTIETLHIPHLLEQIARLTSLVEIAIDGKQMYSLISKTQLPRTWKHSFTALSSRNAALFIFIFSSG